MRRMAAGGARSKRRNCCRCFLPDLTGFTIRRSTGPGRQTTMPKIWRREGDSNPRYTFVGIHTISSRAPSAARTSLHTGYMHGGEGGIRTPVRACGPQIDFESIPLRPLRYLSVFLLNSPSYPFCAEKSTQNFTAFFRQHPARYGNRVIEPVVPGDAVQREGAPFGI